MVQRCNDAQSALDDIQNGKWNMYSWRYICIGSFLNFGSDNLRFLFRTITHYGQDQKADVFSDNVLKCIFYNESAWIPRTILLKCSSHWEYVSTSSVEGLGPAMRQTIISLEWRQNECDSVSNHQRLDCLPKRVFRRRSKKITKLRITGLCAGNSPMTGEIPAQMASYVENVSIWWRHHPERMVTLFCEGNPK